MESKTILLVEDNPDDIDLTLRAFKKHNLANHVDVARDGVEALDYIFGTGAHEGRESASTLQVVLLDLKLPKVDGLEVLRKLREDERTKYLPVVILTSSNEEQDLMESYRHGVNSYIRKPVEFDKFVETAGQLGLYWLLINQSPYPRQ